MWQAKQSLAEAEHSKGSGTLTADGTVGLVVGYSGARLRGALLGGLILQAPHAVLVREPLSRHANLGQDADLRPGAATPSTTH